MNDMKEYHIAMLYYENDYILDPLLFDRFSCEWELMFTDYRKSSTIDEWNGVMFEFKQARRGNKQS